MTPRIQLTIDEVILRGVPPQQAEAVVAQFRATLAELAGAWLIQEGGAVLAARAESSRRLPPVAVPADAPGALGAAIAARVWGDLSTGGRSGPGARR
jgi:hypothetical protein